MCNQVFLVWPGSSEWFWDSVGKEGNGLFLGLILESFDFVVVVLGEKGSVNKAVVWAEHTRSGFEKTVWLCRRGFREEAGTISGAAVLKALPLPRPTRTHWTVHTVGRGTHRKFSHESWSPLGSVGSEKSDNNDTTVSAFTWLVEKKGRGLGFKKMFYFRGVEWVFIAYLAIEVQWDLKITLWGLERRLGLVIFELGIMVGGVLWHRSWCDHKEKPWEMRKEGTGGSPQRPQHLESRDTKGNTGGEHGGKGHLTEKSYEARGREF